jgi:hypothetical protein
MKTNYVVPLLLVDSTNESGNVFSTKITNLRGTIIDADIVDGNGNVLKSVKLIMNSMYKKYTFTLTNK